MLPIGSTWGKSRDWENPCVGGKFPGLLAFSTGSSGSLLRAVKKDVKSVKTDVRQADMRLDRLLERAA